MLRKRGSLGLERIGAALVLVLTAAAGACDRIEPPAVVSSAPGESAATRNAVPGNPDLVEGYVVWESNRSGAWRIWTRDLAGGSPPRQLTADEESRQHCCPHISPDGLRVAYLSLEGVAGYAAGGSGGELRLISADGGEERVLAPRARSLFENRAVVWRSPTELVFIRGDLGTVLLDIQTGRERELSRSTDGSKRTWLINSKLSHAVTGSVDFSPYDPKTRVVAQRRRLSGCQPYFSHDGRWGIWTGGTGGPVHRIELASGTISTILNKSDSRIPDGLGYVYFPMISADGRLFSFAGSNYEHPHFEADYEVFVAETDPETLEIRGDAVRMTHHPATDRFPDAFLAQLGLGRHRGEAPFEVVLEPGADADAQPAWSFDLGDGTSASGPSARHTYPTPGRYRITAVSDDGAEAVTLRGHVIVDAAKAPKPIAVSLADQGRAVELLFDEEIATDAPEIRFDSARAVRAWSIGSDGRTLIVEPSEPVESFDRITVSGVRDRAQVANRMEPASLEIEPPLWPSDRSGLVFLWQTGNEPNLVPDPSIGRERASIVDRTGGARLDHDYAMTLGRGSFGASRADSDSIFEGCTKSNRCTLELLLRPEPAAGARLRPVISFSNGSPSGRNFLLAQKGDRLVFSPRAGNRGPQSVPEFDLGRIPPEEPSHVVVSYEPGRLLAFVNGKRVVSEFVKGGFFHWRRRPLIFGAQPVSGEAWRGALEGIAIYNRFLEGAETRENLLRYRASIEARPPVARIEVEARLAASSDVPTLREISPYREALAVFEYQVHQASNSLAGGDRLRVAHWVILDGTPLEVARATPGDLHRLVLEAYAANPQLEGAYLSDTLPPDSGPLFYAVDY